MYFLFALTWSVGISVDEDGRKEVDLIPLISPIYPPYISRISPVYLLYISVDEDGWTGCRHTLYPTPYADP